MFKNIIAIFRAAMLRRAHTAAQLQMLSTARQKGVLWDEFTTAVEGGQIAHSLSTRNGVVWAMTAEKAICLKSARELLSYAGKSGQACRMVHN